MPAKRRIRDEEETGGETKGKEGKRREKKGESRRVSRTIAISGTKRSDASLATSSSAYSAVRWVRAAFDPLPSLPLRPFLPLFLENLSFAFRPFHTPRHSPSILDGERSNDRESRESRYDADTNLCVLDSSRVCLIALAGSYRRTGTETKRSRSTYRSRGIATHP